VGSLGSHQAQEFKLQNCAVAMGFKSRGRNEEGLSSSDICIFQQERRRSIGTGESRMPWTILSLQQQKTEMQWFSQIGHEPCGAGLFFQPNARKQNVDVCVDSNGQRMTRNPIACTHWPASSNSCCQNTNERTDERMRSSAVSLPNQLPRLGPAVATTAS